MTMPVWLAARSVHLLGVEPHFTGAVCYRPAEEKVGSWLVVYRQGRLAFVHHTLEPLERLERCLRRLRYRLFSISRQNCLEIRLHAEELLAQKGSLLPGDLLALTWAVEQGLLPREAAAKLASWIIEEALENLLLVAEELQQEAVPLEEVPTLGYFDAKAVFDLAQKRLQAWQALGPEITSPYQRPYFASQAQVHRLSPQQQEYLSRLLRGFSFRQLSAILDQDDLVIAQRLHPLIKAGILVLRDPQPPFSYLPKAYAPERTGIHTGNLPTLPVQVESSLESLGSLASAPKTWVVACIDDSEAMLGEIKRLLEGQNLSIHTISDPLKALMKLTGLKPDLILLDVGMPNLDGYQICSLIRKSSVLKDVPVVMVTGHKGLIDRARARLAGATDYLTKPFRQEELLQVVFRYLS